MTRGRTIAQEEGGDRVRDRSAERRRVARPVAKIYMYICIRGANHPHLVRLTSSLPPPLCQKD